VRIAWAMARSSCGRRRSASTAWLIAKCPANAYEQAELRGDRCARQGRAEHPDRTCRDIRRHRDDPGERMPMPELTAVERDQLGELTVDLRVGAPQRGRRDDRCRAPRPRPRSIRPGVECLERAERPRLTWSGAWLGTIMRRRDPDPARDRGGLRDQDLGCRGRDVRHVVVLGEPVGACIRARSAVARELDRCRGSPGWEEPRRPPVTDPERIAATSSRQRVACRHAGGSARTCVENTDIHVAGHTCW